MQQAERIPTINDDRNDIMKPYYGVDDGGSIGVEGTQGDTGTKANAGAQAAKGTQGFRGGYEDFHLTSAQVEHIKRNNAIKAISKYIKENSVAPSSTEEYFTVTDEELEQYRRIFYSIYLGRGYVPSQSDDSVGNKTYTVSYNLTGCTKATYSETYDAGSRVPSVTFYPKANYEFYKVTCAEGSGTPKWLLLDTVDSYSTPSIAEITSNWTYNIMCKSKTLKRVPEQELECSIE